MGRNARTDPLRKRVWALAISSVIAFASGCAQKDHVAPPDYSRTPVLFVHGHGLNSRNWQEVMGQLVKIGYPPEYLHAVDIVPNTMGNVEAATTVIAPEAESLFAKAVTAASRAGYEGEAPQRVDIVSHSMGAVSSRWYVAKLHPERVRTWIGLAGASHGTNALCPYSDEAAREMCPAFATSDEENAVQVALNGTPDKPVDETPYGLGTDREVITRVPPDGARNILYFTVRLEPDAWIKPEDSAILDGAGGVTMVIPSGVPVNETTPGNYLFLERVGHDPLLQHPDLICLLAAMLALRDA